VNRIGSYGIHVYGAPEKSTIITGARAIALDEIAAVCDAVAEADVLFTAVGGKNLAGLVPVLAKSAERKLKRSDQVLNIVTCENWHNPSETLRNGILQALAPDYVEPFERRIGVSEAVVMRSGIEPETETLEKDPLAVNVSDYWELPVDASKIRRPFPAIKGVVLMDAFAGFLERKFFTYNAANATVSYLGRLKNHVYLADAAHDPDILEILNGVYEETQSALAAKYLLSGDERSRLAGSSLRKLQDREIRDFIERNARDPVRKLGPNDRLVGPARLALEFGGEPVNLATAIAAALFYENSSDSAAVELRERRATEGIDSVLTDVCGINPTEKLGRLVEDGIRMLKSKGWIAE